MRNLAPGCEKHFHGPNQERTYTRKLHSLQQIEATMQQTQQQQVSSCSCYVGKMRSKICGVCGDKAKSYHFGGISCDSCKAFFRRSVQNEAYKHFQCPYESRCHISMSSRKCCQSCRFRKCLEIGMEKSWVMSEQERMRLHTLRLQKKIAQDRKRKWASTQDVLPSATFIHQHLKSEEVSYMSKITSIYQSIMSHDFVDRPFPHQVANFAKVIENLIRFAKSVPQFQNVSHVDQIVLLRSRLYEMCVIVNAIDANCQMSNSTSCNSDGGSSPSSSSASIYSSMGESDDEIYRPDLLRYNYDNNNNFSDIFTTTNCINLRHFKEDSRLFVLFLLIILFNPDAPDLVDKLLISNLQDRFCDILRRYVEWKVGPLKSASFFGAILCLLPELCEIKEKRIQELILNSEFYNYT